MNDRAAWAANLDAGQGKDFDGPAWEEMLGDDADSPPLSLDSGHDAGDGSDGGAGEVEGGGQSSQAQILCGMLRDAELFHDSDSISYATVPVEEHVETLAIRSEGLRRYLRYIFFRHFRKPPQAQTVLDVLGVLEARAQHEGPELPVFVRVGSHEETIYIDLADKQWRAVAISRRGWEVVDRPPIRFRRSRGLLELRRPATGGSLEPLRALLGVEEADWLLIITWILMAYRPQGPYPILSLHGEQGSGKSTRARILRRLVDPNGSPLRAEPHGSRDLMIAARNSWLLAFDNLSSVRPWLSDCLCRLATGGGFSTRELYTDAEELIINATRPMIINGIERLGSRGDLLERSLLVELNPIDDRQRRTEAELWSSFDEVHARVFGALLDILVRALGHLDEVRLESLPRMADFAKWGVAVERALGEPDGSFLSAYSANTRSGHELALECDTVAMVLLQYLARRGGHWSGTASELMGILSAEVGDHQRRMQEWPKSASSLGGKLRRLQPHLRAHGIEITASRRGTSRRIDIATRPASASLPSSVSQ